jgi:protein-S-isoprenylcysteine O-methyltransferase Ste14
MSGLEILVLGAYGLVLIELVFLPVPSEASTYQLLAPATKYTNRNRSERLLQAQRLSLERKLWLFLLPTALTVGIFLFPLLQIFFPCLKDYLFPFPAFETPLFHALAGGLILLGSAVTLMSVVRMRRGMVSCGQSERPLQIQGTFQWSRNPGLVGNYMLFLGLFFFLPTLGMALGFGVYLFNMHYRILLEESQLEVQFGKAYQDYKHRVPRYIGRCREEKSG